MNYSELVTEVQDRGFSHVSSTRVGRWVNAAIHELHSITDWPFLEASTTGTSPLTITDLGRIETVTNESNNQVLDEIDWQTLSDSGDLSLSGSPQSYYVAWPAGSPVVATYPSNSDTIGVQYWKTTSDLSGTDALTIPARFHGIVVDLAVVRGYLDSDNFGAAQALRAEVDRQVQRMMGELLTGRSSTQRITDVSVDW